MTFSFFQLSENLLLRLSYPQAAELPRSIAALDRKKRTGNGNTLDAKHEKFNYRYER